MRWTGVVTVVYLKKALPENSRTDEAAALKVEPRTQNIVALFALEIARPRRRLSWPNARGKKKRSFFYLKILPFGPCPNPL